MNFFTTNLETDFLKKNSSKKAKNWCTKGRPRFSLQDSGEV